MSLARTGLAAGAKPKRRAAKKSGPVASGDTLASPMQGTIVKVAVEEGQEVKEGDLIVVLEAMKMEQPLNAHKSGTIKGLGAEVGASPHKDSGAVHLRDQGLNFPNRQALMSAVFEDAVGELLARSRELRDAPQPCVALVSWLREMVTHASEYRGLARALMAVTYDDTSALAKCSGPSGRRGVRCCSGRRRRVMCVGMWRSATFSS
jgi:hypothetical protein